jgi:phosphate/sulfate permease
VHAIKKIELFSQGQLGGEFYVPFWVVITCQGAIGLGTLVGGWRIVHTVGSKITRLTPVQGSCAATAGAIMLFAATYLGIPVSTTHTVTGSVIGVGAARKVSAVRWNVAGNIVIAWIITLPAAALIEGGVSRRVSGPPESPERSDTPCREIALLSSSVSLRPSTILGCYGLTWWDDERAF